MNRFHRLYIYLILASFLLLIGSSVVAQDSALANSGVVGSIEVHLIPENAPVEIWRTDGNQIVEGWVSVSTWQRLRTATLVSGDGAEIVVHSVPFSEQINIWRVDGGQIIEGWVSEPGQ